MIERLRKDIADHEVVIETLRKIIGDEELIEKELMKVINKGPPRMRVPTREELRMEIKKLKGKLGKGGTKKDADKPKGDVLSDNLSELENAPKEASVHESEMMMDADVRKRLEENVSQLQQELKDKNDTILNLKEEQENLKVEIRARDMNINKQSRSIQELHAEVRDLRLLETELKQLLSKKLAVDEQNTDLKTQLLDKFVDNTKTDIETKEKEIESRGLLAKLTSLQDQVETLKNDKIKLSQEHQQQQAILRAELNKLRNHNTELVNDTEAWQDNVKTLES